MGGTKNNIIKIMCKCKNIKMGSFENQSEVVNPFTGKKVSIDNCIIQEVSDLWKKGIKTIGSCCGHNKTVPTIVVPESENSKMQALGYKKLYCPFNSNIYISKKLYVNPWFLFKIEVISRIKFEIINKIKLWKSTK